MPNNLKYKIELPARIIFTNSPVVVEGIIICENYSGEVDVFDLPQFKFISSENPTREIIFTSWQVSMITFL